MIVLWTGIVLVMVFFLGTTLYAAFKSAPFVPTPETHIVRALEVAGLRPGEMLYDIGSGDGRALIIAANRFGARARGFELSFPLYLFSLARVFLKARTKNIRVFWKDFFGADIRDADVVFCWLTPRAFPKLKEKFERELKPGAGVITYSSPLGFWEPTISIPLENGFALYCYEKKK